MVTNDAPGADDADAPVSSVGENDIAWPVPMAAIGPLAAVFAAAIVWAFGLDWVLVSVVPFVVFLAIMTVIDLRELRIPDKLTGPAAIAAVPLLALSLLSDWSDISLLRALLGALAMGAFYFILFFIYPPGMGWGDVKLAPLIGAQLAFFGWVPFVRSLIISHLVSGVVAIVIVGAGLLSRGGLRWKAAFPFAPFMAIGAVAALILEGAFG